MDKSDTSIDQMRKYVDDCFSTYENEGFSKVFVSPYDLFPKDQSYQGKPFAVMGRVREMTDNDRGKDTSDLECLPMWIIKFEDGYTMGAYPEEIIPSEIKANIWRESDKKYLAML